MISPQVNGEFPVDLYPAPEGDTTKSVASNVPGSTSHPIMYENTARPLRHFVLLIWRANSSLGVNLIRTGIAVRR
jgi:hypothetical protein